MVYYGTLVGTALADGSVQITPRGGTMVFNDEHLALWERGRGSTAKDMTEWHHGDGLFPQAVATRRRHFEEGRHRAVLWSGEDFTPVRNMRKCGGA
jgi:hypothetical protein